MSLLLFLILFYRSGLCAERKPPSVSYLLTVKELAAKAGYTVTDFEVMTEDGYSIWIFRIGNKTGQPVLFQHGVTLSAESWILRGKDKDLAFLLLKEGFDVWLTNTRGTVYNEYSLAHNKSDRQFWDFSFHESAYYDLPAFIETILHTRRRHRLFYIGHSLGTTMFLAMTSLRPEYNSKIRVAVLLSPIAFPPSPEEMSLFFRIILRYADLLYRFLSAIGQHQFLLRTSNVFGHIVNNALRLFCGERSLTQSICMSFIGLFLGGNNSNLNKSDFGTFLTYTVAGTSIKCMLHLSQIYRSGEFKQFDYGNKSLNYQKYGNEKPPHYNLKLIKARVALFWSLNDPLLSESSVKKLADLLPNLLYSKAVPDPLFSHLDMILGMNTDKVLYPTIINLLKLYQVAR